MLKSFLGTFHAIFSDSVLRDIVQLIYTGEIAADSILKGNSYDKVIRAYFLIDADVIQQVVTPNIFTDTKLSVMERSVNNASNNQNGQMVKDPKCVQAGRTPALCLVEHQLFGLFTIIR